MITVQSHPLFVTSIAKTMIYDFNKVSLIENILNLEKNIESARRSNAGGWQSPHYDNRKFDNPYAADLFQNNIIPILDQTAEAWGYPKTKNLSYWYNLNRRYNYNQPHYHPHALLSGVIYLKVPANSGKLTFLRATTEQDRMDFITTYQFETNDLCPDNPNINVLHWEQPQENLLILFPGHLEHHVEQNLTSDVDDLRISLSFNYFL
jgi:uncharacterized protein (TIGR02466 family)